MKTNSLTMCLVLGATWSVACGDDSGSNESAPDAAVDEATEDEATEDEATEDEATEDEATEDEATEDEATEDEATEDEATEDEATEDEATEDEATEDEATEDEATEDESSDDAAPDGGADHALDGGANGDAGLDAGDVTDETDDVSAEDSGSPAGDAGDSVDSGDQPLEGEIGAEGGSFEGLGASLVVPPDSIEPPSVIAVQQVQAANEEGLVSLAWDFSPNGITFDPPASLTLPFDTGAAGGQPVVIAWLDGDDTWVPLTDCVVAGDEVTCPVSHFTTFGVILEEAADAGGSTGGECALPPCALEIDFESCTPDVAETCQMVGGLPPTAINVCYENGTKAQISNLTSEPITMNFKTAEGDACYGLEISGATSGNYEYAFKNAEGDVVMTAQVDADTPDIVTYTCDGQDYVVDFSTPECEGESRPPSQDTEGCSFTTCEY